MRTAISVPEEQGASITDRINEIYRDEDSRLDPAFHAAQLSTLDKDPWQP